MPKDRNVVPFAPVKRERLPPPPGPGRPKGSPNKNSKLIKDAYLIAASETGFPVTKMVRTKVGEKVKLKRFENDAGDIEFIEVEREEVYENREVTEFLGRDGIVGYLKWVAQTESTAFTQGLRQIMGKQMTIEQLQPPTEDAEQQFNTPEEAAEYLRNHGQLPEERIKEIVEQLYGAMDQRASKAKIINQRPPRKD